MRARTIAAAVYAVACAAQTPSQVVVIVNENAPESRSAGEYYARRRGVPAENVCRLRAAREETIPRVKYEAEIARPVARFLRDRGLVEKALFLVTTMGVPLRIAGRDGAGGDQAAVDSELTLLYQEIRTGKAHPAAGMIPNPYYRAEGRFSHPAYPMYLVTRLAGFTFADVRGMVDRALAAKDRGKVVLDLRGDGEGDEWLFAAAARLPRERVLLDDRIPVVYGARDVIGYGSWGSNDHQRTERDLRFGWLPGALATEFVSTNARTFREPPKEWQLGWKWSPPSVLWVDSPQSLSADYVRQGATGVSGHVYEPYLSNTVRPQILFPAYLLEKATLAEAFYRSMPALSWQNVILGDPLCRLERE